MTAKIATAEWSSLKNTPGIVPYKEGGIFLGVDPTTEEPYGLAVGEKGHIGLRANTRGGKMASFIGPNCALWPGSLFVLDVKDGEIATVFAPRRGEGNNNCKGMKQKVAVFDYGGVTTNCEKYLATFNPIEWVAVGTPGAVQRALYLVDSLMPIGTEADPYWVKSGKKIAASIIAHVATHESFEGRRDFTEVLDLVNRGDWELCEGMIERNILIDDDLKPTPVLALLEAMSKNVELDGFVCREGDFMKGMVREAARQWFGIQGHVKSALTFLEIPEVRKVLSSSSFSFSELKTAPNGFSFWFFTGIGG